MCRAHCVTQVGASLCSLGVRIKQMIGFVEESTQAHEYMRVCLCGVVKHAIDDYESSLVGMGGAAKCRSGDTRSGGAVSELGWTSVLGQRACRRQAMEPCQGIGPWMGIGWEAVAALLHRQARSRIRVTWGHRACGACW